MSKFFGGRSEVTKHLSERQFDQLMDFLKTRTDKESLLIELLARTGMRTEELCELRKGNFNVQDSTVFIEACKSSNSRTVRLPKRFMSKLAEHVLLYVPANLPMKSLISPSIETKAAHRKIRRIWARVKNECFKDEEISYGVHCLRHTYGVRVYAQTRDLLKTQAALGHVDPRNTLRYMAAVEEKGLQDDILKAVGH